MLLLKRLGSDSRDQEQAPEWIERPAVFGRWIGGAQAACVLSREFIPICFG